MTCTNCGKELSQEMKFCDNCGTKIEQPVSDTQEAKEVQEAPVSEVAVDNNSEITQKPPKKSKKGLIIGIIIVALIAVIAIAFPLLKNLFTKTFASNEDYFKTTEKANAEKAIELLADLFDTYEEQGISDTDGLVSFLNSKRYDMGISLDLNEGVVGNLSEISDADISFLKNVMLNYGIELDGDNVNLTLSLGFENKKLLTADVVINTKSFVTYVTIPELSDTAMKLDLEKLTGQDISAIFESEDFKKEFENAISIYGKLPDGKTFKGILERYLDVILGQVKKVEKTDRTVVINEKNSTYTQLSTIFTPDDLEALSLALLDELKNDEQIWDILEGFSEAIPELNISRSNFNDEYKNMVADIDGTYDDLGNVTYSILVNKIGAIVGRELSNEGGDLVYFVCNEDGFVLDTKDDGFDTVSIRFNGNLFADVCEGDAALTVEGVDILNIKVENVKSDGSEAKLTIVPAEGMVEELEYIQATSEILQLLGIDLTECSIVLRMTSELDTKTLLGKMQYGMALTSDEGPVASITAKTEYSKPDGIEIPEESRDISNEEDLIGWITTADILGFIGSLPESISNLITGILMSNIVG